MKFIDHCAGYWPQEPAIKGMWKQIARAVQIPYQGSKKEGESDEEYVKRIILKPALIEGNLNDLNSCVFNTTKGHFSCLEFGTVYLKVTYHNPAYNKIYSFYKENPYSKIVRLSKETYITTNLRVLVENFRMNDLYLWEDHNYNNRYTFWVLTDIGVTREFNRHRASMSIVEQSTRYCNYSKNKFNNELTFATPAWAEENIEDATVADTIFLSSLEKAENSYMALIKEGWKPEQARQVLPLCTRTMAVYCADYDSWAHFLQLRADNISGRAHPNMHIVASKIKEILLSLRHSVHN